MNQVLLILRERGISQEWLAKQLGIRGPSLWRTLHVTEYPQYRRVHQIASILGVEMESLVDSEGRWQRASELEGASL